MNLSPSERAQVLQAVAQIIADEIRAEVGGSFANLYCIELAVAEKMLGLDRRTIKKEMDTQALTSGKHAVRLADLQRFLDDRTQAAARKKEGRAA